MNINPCLFPGGGTELDTGPIAGWWCPFFSEKFFVCKLVSIPICMIFTEIFGFELGISTKYLQTWTASENFLGFTLIFLVISDWSLIYWCRLQPTPHKNLPKMGIAWKGYLLIQYKYKAKIGIIKLLWYFLQVKFRHKTLASLWCT